MLVMPNSTESIYTRLWCVAEIKVAKDLNLPIRIAYETGTAMRQLLSNFTSVRNAQCSEPSDKARIQGAIAGQEDAIDSLIQELVEKEGAGDQYTSHIVPTLQSASLLEARVAAVPFQNF